MDRLLGLRRLHTRRRLAPRPTVPLDDDAPSGLTLAGGVSLSFAALRRYKATQLELYDAGGPNQRLLYQIVRDPHYEPKK